MKSRTLRFNLRRTTCGAFLVCIGLLAANASSPTRAHAAPDGADAWTAPVDIPSALSDEAPALAQYGGLLYAMWPGQSSPTHVWYSAFNGSSWTGRKTIPSALTGLPYSAEALASYDGLLYAAWSGQTLPGAHIWYSAFNGTTWSGQAKVPSALTGGPIASPDFGLAAYNSDLYLVWVGKSSPAKIWYSAFDGATWTTQKSIPGLSGGCCTAVTAYDGNLYVFFINSSLDIADASFNGTTWTSPTTLVTTAFSDPAVAVVNGLLYDVWTDAPATGGYGDQMYSAFNGATWTPAAAIPSSLSCNGVGASAYNSSLYVAWQGGDCGNSAGIPYSSGP